MRKSILVLLIISTLCMCGCLPAAVVVLSVASAENTTLVYETRAIMIKQQRGLSLGFHWEYVHESTHSYGICHTFINSVEPLSDADKAGLKPNDEIISVNNSEYVSGPAVVMNGFFTNDECVTLKIKRNNTEEHTIVLKTLS